MYTAKKAKETRYFAPYLAPNVCALKTTGTGVYFLKDRETNKLLYVGFSAKDVKSTAYRHLQKWTDMRTDYTKKLQAYARVTFNPKKILLKVIFCATIDEAALMEKFLILKYKPPFNTLKLDLYSVKESNYIETKLSTTSEWKTSYEENPF